MGRIKVYAFECDDAECDVVKVHPQGGAAPPGWIVLSLKYVSDDGKQQGRSMMFHSQDCLVRFFQAFSAAHLRRQQPEAFGVTPTMEHAHA